MSLIAFVLIDDVVITMMAASVCVELFFFFYVIFFQKVGQLKHKCLLISLKTNSQTVFVLVGQKCFFFVFLSGMQAGTVSIARGMSIAQRIWTLGPKALWSGQGLNLVFTCA